MRAAEQHLQAAQHCTRQETMDPGVHALLVLRASVGHGVARLRVHPVTVALTDIEHHIAPCALIPCPLGLQAAALCFCAQTPSAQAQAAHVSSASAERADSKGGAEQARPH